MSGPDFTALNQLQEQKRIEDDVKAKELKLRSIRANSQLDKIASADAILNASIDGDTDYAALAISATMDSAQREFAISFPTEAMSEIVLLGPGSLAVFLASTGTGKSSFVSNAAYHLAFHQKKKIAIIVNEEQAKHVAARISCLHLGYSIHKYMRKSDTGYPESIKQEINDNFISLKDKISIIDQHNYGIDMVRSIEGIQKLINSISKKYDAIFIDYYQNIDRSISDPSMEAFQVQERFANYIDGAKNEASGPIILMAQVKKGEDDFEQRMKGRKLIVDKSTDVFEMVIEKDKFRTHIDVLKDRWLGNQGERRTLGYDDGRYIEYSRDFENKVRDIQAAQLDFALTPQDEDDSDDV